MTFSAKPPEIRTLVGEGPFLFWVAQLHEPSYNHQGRRNDHSENESVARAWAYWLAKDLGFHVDLDGKQEATPAAAASHRDLGPQSG